MLWIGVDAHKRVHQAVALDEGGSPAAQTAPNTPAGWAALLQWAQAGAERAWAVEGAGSFGRGLAQFLAERGERVYEVNPRWTARRGARRGGRGRATGWTPWPWPGSSGRRPRPSPWSCPRTPGGDRPALEPAAG